MYRTWENFDGGKNWQIWQIVSYPQKFSSSTFTDTATIKMHLAYVLTVAYSPNFFLTNSFYSYGSPKFPPPKLYGML